MLDGITPEDIQSVARRLIDLAKEGNVQAAKLLLSYAIGKPEPAPNPDRMDIDEWEGYQQTAYMRQEACPLAMVGAPEVHLHFVCTLRPIFAELWHKKISENSQPSRSRSRNRPPPPTWKGTNSTPR